jgi:predicted AlkP superfamily phosphohydrolase/phosphomutase
MDERVGKMVYSHRQWRSCRVQLIRPLICSALLIGLTILFGCGGGSGGDVNPLIVIGLDGATWEVLQPWIDSGKLPALAEIQKASAWGEMESSVPYLSPPAWTSAATGVNPGKHAIFDFQRRIPQQPVIINETAKSRRAQPIWNMLREQGKRVLLMNIPMTDPPDEVNGYFISGFPHADDEGFAYPPELEASLSGYELDQMQLRLIPSREDSILTSYYNQLESRKEIMLDWLANESFDLMWVVFTGTDRVQHLFWVFSDPENPNYNPDQAKLYKDTLLKYWQAQDKVLAEVMAAIKPGTSTLFVSDHGFGPLRYSLKVLNYLHRPETGLTSREAGAVYSLDRGDGCRLYISRAGRDLNAHFSKAKALQIRDKVASVLRSAVDPNTGTSICEDVLYGEEVFSGTYAGKGPDLIIIPSRGYFLMLGDAEPDLELPYLIPHTIKMSGWHRMNGIYLALGDQVAPANRFYQSEDQFSLIDIVPTALYMMGMPIPEGLDGTIMEPIISPEYWQQNQPVMTAPLPEEFRPMTPEEIENLESVPYIG